MGLQERLNTGLTGVRNAENFNDLGVRRAVDFQSKVMFLFINQFRYCKIDTGFAISAFKKTGCKHGGFLNRMAQAGPIHQNAEPFLRWTPCSAQPAGFYSSKNFPSDKYRPRLSRSVKLFVKPRCLSPCVLP